jgi:hypothetical protein
MRDARATSGRARLAGLPPGALAAAAAARLRREDEVLLNVALSRLARHQD